MPRKAPSSLTLRSKNRKETTNRSRAKYSRDDIETFSGKKEAKASGPRRDAPSRPGAAAKRRFGADRSASDRPKAEYSSSSRPARSSSGSRFGADRPKREFDSRERPARAASSGARSGADRPKRDYDSRERPAGKASSSRFGADRPKREFDSRERPSRGASAGRFGAERPKREFDSSERPARRATGSRFDLDRPKREFESRDRSPRPESREGFSSDRPKREYDSRERSPRSDSSSRFNAERPRREFDSREGSARSDSSARFGSDRPKREFDSRERTPRSDSASRFTADRPKREFDSRERPQRSESPRRFSDDRPRRDYQSSERPSRRDAPSREYTEPTGLDVNSTESYDIQSSARYGAPQRSSSPRRTDSSRREESTDQRPPAFGAKRYGTGRPPRQFNSADRPQRSASRDRFESDSFSGDGDSPQLPLVEQDPTRFSPDRPNRDRGSSARLARTPERGSGLAKEKKVFDKDDRAPRKTAAERDSAGPRKKRMTATDRPKRKASPSKFAAEPLAGTDSSDEYKPYGSEKSYQSREQDEETTPRTSLPPRVKSRPGQSVEHTSELRLNKFLADAGIASRRSADELIEAGVVKVNGEVVRELGQRVHPSDLVTVKGEPVSYIKHLTYLVLNKPKDYITTTADDQGRKTVMDLIPLKQRLYPVGRLDRNTTGTLIITNDGEIATRLMHPSYEVEREYVVGLDQKIQNEHAKAIAHGIELEDGLTGPTEILINHDDKTELRIILKEGRNREVRRLFEHFGYEVKRLHRVRYANINVSGMSRGEYRHLSRDEVRTLRKLVKLDV